MKGKHGGTVASQNRRGKDKLEGKIVVITGGVWKGHRGRVKKADDKQVIVEITSKYRQEPIDRNLVRLEDKEDTGTKGGES